MNVMRTMGLAPVLPPLARVEALKDEYVVRLALPGFAREELDVEILGRTVTVRGDQTESGDGTIPFQLHERLEERFELATDVDPAGVTACYSHGAIELRAPRVSCGETPRKLPLQDRHAINADASGV